MHFGYLIKIFNSSTIFWSLLLKFDERLPDKGGLFYPLHNSAETIASEINALEIKQFYQSSQGVEAAHIYLVDLICLSSRIILTDWFIFGNAPNCASLLLTSLVIEIAHPWAH